MKLSTVLKGISYNENINDVEIKSIEINSTKVTKDSLFFCISGINSDGHNFAKEALNKGAYYVICSKDLGLKKQIIVKDTKKAYAVACSNFFENPSKKLKIIAVTGTNGKTSCTYIIKHILEENGFKVGLIGTIQNLIGDEVLRSRYTTPQSFELNSLLKKMLDNGCEYVVMEASSHALDQYRMHALSIKTAVFTNLTQDHLDYHKTMDNYFRAKLKLFDYSKNAIINLDDNYAKEILKKENVKFFTFSLSNDNADLVAKNVKFFSSSIRFEAIFNNNINRFYFGMPGEFSVYNVLAATLCCLTEGISLLEISKALNNFKGVKGRAQVLYDGDFSIICDYAHTDEGLNAFLSSIAPYVKGRLIALFGAAGERDASKRDKMGAAVAKSADYLIITSDNPRTEEPEKIINDTIKGVIPYKKPYKAIPDRYGAILYAIEMLKKDDVLCLLGKGHEDYQVLYNTTIYFDEREIVKEILIQKGLI